MAMTKKYTCAHRHISFFTYALMFTFSQMQKSRKFCPARFSVTLFISRTKRALHFTA